MDLVGKSGSLMAAVFETAGYIYQDHMLRELSDAMAGSVGGFIFLIGIAAGLFGLVIRGSFKLAPWLLIGPPLFFAVILPTDTINQAQWKFAQQDRNQGKVTKRLQDTVQQSGNAQVSKVFKRYVMLVSEVVQEVERRINRIGRAEDRLLIFRGDMLGIVYSGQVTDRDFFFFLHDAFFGQCQRYIYAASIVNDPQFTPTEKSGAEALVGFSMNNYRTDYTVTLQGRALAFYNSRRNSTGGSAGSASRTYQQIAEERNRAQQERFTCDQIYRLTYAGLLEYADRRVRVVTDRAAAGEIPQSQVLADVQNAVFGGNAQATAGQEAAFNSAAIDRLTKTAALYMLRNEYLERTHVPVMANRAAGHAAGVSTEVIDHDNFYQIERARVATLEFAEKTRLMTAAENLPYYQGLALYFLGASFPFFALLLLIPGKHPAFLLWFVLWFWVKSWDVGIAVVAMLDKLLFTVLGFHAQYHNVNTQLEQNFTSAMVQLMNMDPTFQMTTYYNILGVSLMSIPVISSQMILGTLTGGAGLIAAGMSNAGQTVAGGVQSSQQQTAVGEKRFKMHDERRRRMDALADTLYNRDIATQDQRARYRAGSNQYREDFLRFGANVADHLAALPAGQQQNTARSQAQRGTLNLGNRPNGVAPLQQPMQQRPAGGIAYPIAHQNRAFLDQNRLNQTIRSFEAMAQNVSALRATQQAMEQINAPSADIRWGVDNPLTAIVRRNWRSLGGGSAYQMTLIEQELRHLQVSAGALFAWTNFNLNYEAETQHDLGMARALGALEVPWTTASGVVQDDAFDQQLRREHIARHAATWTVIGRILDHQDSGGLFTAQGAMLGWEAFSNDIRRLTGIQADRVPQQNDFTRRLSLTDQQLRDIQRFLAHPPIMGLFPNQPAPAGRGIGPLPGANMFRFIMGHRPPPN